ncbi:AbrB/MazE/SpoVT family DNA-binding domain-containing protein [Candidatus Woesearchaeota archaeon]|nr:AbrB/MazE/SpoVT family DNA-binding domain-containing protein [Candidatus Woesearchaeota archaeon]
MKTAYTDGRGRITLGLKMVNKHGNKFAVVSHGKEIILVPIAKDPLAELRNIWKGSGIDKYTIKELREMALKEAEKEAMGNVRRHRLSSRPD